MSSKKPKATRKRMISCFAQIVQEHIPGWKIEEIASGENENAVEECARAEGVGQGERSELRSSLKAPRRYGLRS